MSQHDDQLYIEDMKSFTSEAIDLTKGISLDECHKNRVLQLALVKLLENIGEASIKVSNYYKENYRNIPWEELRGMRNRLVHGYNKINLEIVYHTCRTDLPFLLNELQKIENL